MPSQSTKSTSPHQSWRVSELPYVSLRLVFWLMLMTPWTIFLVLIWPLAVMSQREREREREREINAREREIRASTLRSGVEKYNFTALFLSLKSLNQLYDAYTKWHPRWIRDSPLPHLAPRDRRHHRSEEQQGDRRQPCEEVGLLHSVVKDFL